MPMKKILLFALVAAIALVMLYIGKMEQKTVRVEALPWQVEVLDENRLGVLGVVVGESTVWHGIHKWDGRPDIGLFESPEGELRLEAYFGKLKIGRVVEEGSAEGEKGKGIFDAYIIARLDASNEQMKEFYENKLDKKPMPSGHYKYELSEKQLSKAHDLPMTELSVIPSTQFSEEVVKQRFGEPDSIRALENERFLWLYGKKGLAMILDSEDKDILHYVTPARFKDLVSRLDDVEAQKVEAAKKADSAEN